MLFSFPKVGLVSFKIKGLNSIWLWYSLVYLNLSLKFLTNRIPTDESLIPQESWNYPEAPNDWTIKFYLWKKILCRYDAALCLGQVTHWILLINFKRSRRVSRSKSRSQSQDHSSSRPSIAEWFPTEHWRVMTYTTKNCQILMKKFFVRCSKSSLVIYETYLMSLSAETKRRVIPATIFFHKYLATFYFK